METDAQNLLIVDDLDANLLALEALLRESGATILKARSGPEALEILLRHDVALALLDVQMPEMDGFQLAALMRGTERTRSIPIIFVTAGASHDGLRFHGYELGAVDFLIKPIVPVVLRSKVNVFLELASQRSKLAAIGREKSRLIDAHAEAERRARESEAMFRELGENVPQLAWMAHPDGSMFWYNRRWYEFTGTSFEQMQGEGWREVQHPDHAEAVIAGFRAAIVSGEPWEDTFPMRDRNGAYRWFLSRAFPLRDREGRITRWFGTNTDVTALREAQDALRRAQETIQRHADELEGVVAERTAKLQETVHELEAFSYSIAHDMRAPLRSMLGYSDLLLEEQAGRLDEDGKEFLARIRSSAIRLDQLIQDVLNYSRIVREDLPLSEVDTRALVLELIETYPNLRGVADRIEVQDNLPRVRANPAALTQVLSNLLSNAVKFTRDEETLRVRVRGERVPRGESPPGASGSWTRLWVEDNGIGLDPEVQPRLFQMFQRFTRPGLYEGTGIGLAIARKAVERMGGAIGVFSAPGRGSRFWILLPLPE